MRVISVTKKQWQDKQFVEVNVDGRVCSNWQKHGLDLKEGDEIEGTITENPGKTPKITITKINGAPVGAPAFGGFKGNPADRIKPFSCSYAKDIAIALLDKGIISKSTEVDATLEHYYNWFIKRMEG